MKKRSASRSVVKLFLIGVCLFCFLQSGTKISSSHSRTFEPYAPAATSGHSSFRELERILFQPARSVSSTKISPLVINDTADGKSTSVVIMMAEQADLSAAYSMQDQDARGWFVYNTLTQHAARTQAGLQSFLKSQDVSYQSFWAANLLVADANRSLVEQLAGRADVARIDSNRPGRWVEDPEIAKFSVAPNSVNAVEPGVSNVNAPAVWALGFTGQGIVVGDLDTGMRWSHNALKPKYRGWNGVTADHNFNWHDAIHSGGGSCGPNTVAPCDDHGHGTHTAGTTVGDDGTGNQVGVAPGAKWIGCRNMDQGNGTPATYTECFQFMIAPTDLAGNNANPTLRPHVLNNSWGCPASEGCTTHAELETIVNNTQAAGIFVEVSAGNSGPGCSTVADPPAEYSASFSTGAINASDNTLAPFSSRGPSTFYTPNILKPNISAPGVNVRSATRTSDTSFGNMSGTSMAGPHVVGVIALIWSARPSFVRNIAATKTLLQNSANPAVGLAPTQTCGGTPSTQIPNNSFGYGRVDALAAYNASAPTAAPARISGQILDAASQPIGGVVITISSGANTVRVITDGQGVYTASGLPVGSLYTVTPARANYVFSPANRSFSLTADRTDAVFTGAEVPPEANPLDTPEFFVRQQYLDFLGREPEQAGLDYWSAQLQACGTDAGCWQARRTDVSAAFFISQEFQLSGSYLYNIYKGALTRPPAFNEYASDRQQLVGGADLEAERSAFALNFVQRSEFTARYQTQTTAASFVDALLGNAQAAGVDLSGERQNLLNAYNGAANLVSSRAAVVQMIADNQAFKQSQYNQAFVQTEYFAYLRRDPDQAGANFWLNVLNAGDPGNYRGMVCAFVTSTEYQNRFSQFVSHSNRECSGQ
jgi:subtilisin family serine protease